LQRDDDSAEMITPNAEMITPSDENNSSPASATCARN